MSTTISSAKYTSYDTATAGEELNSRYSQNKKVEKMIIYDDIPRIRVSPEVRDKIIQEREEFRKWKEEQKRIENDEAMAKTETCINCNWFKANNEKNACKSEDWHDTCKGWEALQEKTIEKSCIAYARRRGWDCWKNENNGNKGIPDYSLLSPDGRFVMVEFKRSATAHVRPEQKTWAARHPDIVFFCHDLETFTKILI